LITRDAFGVKLTPAGVATLRSLQRELQAILAKKPCKIVLKGRVSSGMGEGSYYMDQRGYRRQFKRVLGFNPYSGTLDVKLDTSSLERRRMLEKLPGKLIEGFTTPKRTFGPVKCFSARVRKTKAAVIIPSRSHYIDVIELIAPRNLRKSLRLRDGDELEIEVMP
jgi:riboflavin kinase